MTNLITDQNTSYVDSACGTYFINVSTLGLPAGVWPNQLATDLGNGQPFIMGAAREHEGDLLSIDYRQGNGCLALRVYND